MVRHRIKPSAESFSPKFTHTMSKAVRSSSFDEGTLRLSASEDDGRFKPLRKAWTMLNQPTYRLATRLEFHEADVLYRRHFNAEDVPLKRMLKKGVMSLEGLEGTWLKEGGSSAAAALVSPPACIIVVDW